MVVVLSKLHGVDRELEARLKVKGVKDSEDLIDLCARTEDMDQLAAELRTDTETLRALVNRANLARIRGIGEAYTVLLEAAGVKSVGDLATRSPDELRAQMEHINESQRVVGRVPALAMVNGWVNKAQKLPKG